MKAKFTTFLFVLFSLCSSNMFSQLSAGSTAPNWTIVDIDGNSHTLYDYLDAGKTVVLDFSATWCGPCWSYHQSHVLEDLYVQKGPGGTDEVMVISIESDLSTNLDCIYDLPGCNSSTWGDWTVGVTYPIVNLTSSNGPGVGNAYNINFYPTLYSICPDRKVYEVGQPPLSTWINWISSCTLEGSGAVTANENCFGDLTGQVDVTSSGGWGTNSFLWSNGATTEDLIGVGAGTYNLTVTEGQGHFVELGPFVVDGPATPVEIAVSNVNNVSCAGQGNGSIVTSTMGGVSGGYQYMWNTGSSNPSLSGLAGGTYTLTVTDLNGCTDVESAVVVEPPVLTLSNTTTPENCFQGDGTLSLSAGGGSAGYLYNIGNGPTPTSTFNNLQAGTYVATVTDNNGCTEVTTGIVAASLPPNSNGGPNETVDCINTQAVLDGTGSASGGFIVYNWTTVNGNIVSGGTTMTPTVDAAGTYTLTVTDQLTGCSSSDNVDVVGNYVLPNANAGPSQSIDCANNQVTLNGSGSSSSGSISYLWTTTNGNIVGGETTPNPLVNATGSYTLIVTDNTTGCSETDDVVVLGNTTAPTASAGPNGLIDCNANVITLDGTASSSGAVFSYQWTTTTGNITGGSTSLTPTVDASGTYTLVVTNSSNNCTSESETQVTIDNTPPNANAGNGAELSCSTTSVTLDGSGSSGGSNLSYQWFDNSNNSISNNVTVDVNNAGNYSLVVTNNDNGCDATSSVTVTINNTAPTANAGSSGALNCNSTSVTLNSSGSSNGAYSWFDSNGTNIGNGATVDVTNAGDYDLVVTDNNNGCTAVTTVNVVANTNAPTANIAPPASITCTNGTVNLDGSGSSSGGNYAYEWFDSNGSSIGMGTNISVNAGGDYSLVVTDLDNGCTDSNTETVNVEAVPPVVNAGSGATLDCNNTNVTLAGSGSSPSGNVSFEWFDSNGNSVGTTAQVSVSTSGTYSLVVTDTGNGCSSSEDAIVDENYAAPTSNAGNAGQLDCTNTSVTLDGSGSSSGTEFNYNWVDNNGNSIGTGVTVSVSTTGDYNLIITNTTNGCESTSTVSVTENIAEPTANANSGGILDCNVGTVTLNSNGSSTGTYEWFDVTGASIGNGATVDVSNAGEYSLVVTDTNNGCTASTPVSVTSNTTAPSASIAPAGSLDCVNTSVDLDGTASSSGTNFSYEWLDASGNPVGTGAIITVSAGGDYTLVVTDSDNGCTASALETVVVEASLPSVNAEADGFLTCNNNNVNLTGSSNTGGVSFEWIDPNGVSLGNSPNINVSIAGTYSFVVTDNDNGCAATSNVVVIEDTTEPTVTLGNAAQLDCNNSFVTLDASASSAGANFAYQWQDGTGANIGTGATVDVSDPGIYSLIITNTETGCEASNNVEVALNIEAPNAAVTSNTSTLTCATTTAVLNASSSSTGSNISYQWSDSNGASLGTGITVDVSNPGEYNLMVTNNDNGCATTSNIIIDENTEAPQAEAASLNALDCTNTSTVLDGFGSSTGAQFSYQWQDVNGAILSTDISTEVSTAGVYTFNVLNGDNGCFSSASVEVIALADIPVANAGISGILNCNTTSLILDGGASSTGSEFSYEWTTTNGAIAEGGTTLNPTVIAAGEYSLLVTNTSNGCTAISEITVTQTPELSVELGNVTSINCFGEINGGASVAVSGGTGTYNYQWSNGVTEASLNNVAAGTYEVIVTDSDQCSATISVTIDEPNALVANAASTDESSFQGNNGTVTATPTGGNGTYTYLWSNGSTEASQSDLAPGVYTVEITDENGCMTEQTVTVTEYICSISSDVNSLNISCNGADDGQATAFLTVGSNPTFEWNTGETTGTIMGLGTGTYTVTITDDANCPSIQTVTIEQPPAINTTITNVVNVSCANDLTGSATVEALGGIGNLTYQWSTGATTSTVENIGAGTYTATVTDENFCSTTIEAIVTANDSEFPTASSQDVAISLNASGVAIISPNMVDNGSTDNCGIASMEISQSTFDCAHIGTNEVTLTIIDGAGNASMATAMVTVTDDIAPTIGCVDNIVSSNCNGVAYSMPSTADNCGVANVELINGLSSGAVFPVGMTEVTYRVTDDSGNEAFCSFFVTVENTLALESESAVMPNCNGEANGSLTNVIGGGTAGYTYLWNDGQTTETATNLVAGTYTLMVTDANGCEFETTSTLGEPEALTFDFEANDPPCFGAVNGTITAIVGGGTSGYTYAWSNGQTNATATGLEADTYTVEVTDANGCIIASPEITLTEPAQLVWTLDNVTNTSTPTSMDGGAEVTIEGGVGNYTYAWELNGVIVSTDEDLTGADAGEYLLTVTDENGCEVVSDVITIESPVNNIDLTLENYIKLLPNPTTGTIFIQLELPQMSAVQVRIYDITGKEIVTSPQQNISTNQLEFNLEQFVNGVYVVKVMVNDSVLAKRIVLQKF